MATRRYWIERLSEPSTYIGLMGLAVLLGMSESGFKEIANAIAGVFGFILILLEERK
jgi:hypothetical protein